MISEEVRASTVTAPHSPEPNAESARATRRLAAVAETALALVDAEHITDLITVIAEQGLSALGADGGAVAVPAPDDPTTLLSYITTNYGPGVQANYGHLSTSDPLPVCEAFTTVQRVLLADHDVSCDYSPQMADVVASTGRSAWACVPLRAGEQVVGVLTAGWLQAQSFDAGQLELLDTFAAQCAQALQRLHARDAERAATAEQAALVAVTQALGDAEDETGVLNVVAEYGASLLRADGSALCLPEPAGSHARVLTTDTYTPDVRHQLRRLPLDFPLPAVATATTGVAFFHSNRAQTLAAHPGAEDLYAAGDVQASAAVPLRAHGRLLGCFFVSFTHARPWPRGDRDLLGAFATLTAQALQRLQSRDAERAATTAARASAAAARSAAAQQAALVDVAQALGESESEAQVLAVVAGRGLTLFGASAPALCLLEPGANAVRTLTLEEVPAGIRTQLQHLPADYPLPLVDCAVHGAAHFMDDLAQTIAAFPAAEPICVPLGVQAQGSVPLHARGQLLGSLSLGFTHTRTWPQTDRDLLGAFAALTAQALARISAHDAERAASAEVARFSETLQRSLLTSPPEPDHLHIAVRYAPAAEQAAVGGDWYDAFVTADGATSLIIGDVTGHDQIAAAAMGQLRNLLRGIGYAAGAAPASILTTLDRAAHDLGVDTTATLVLGRLEQTPEQRRRGERLLRWSNAGHLPPLLITPDGSVSYLEATPDLMLGVAPGLRRYDHEVVLAPGSTVLLYTDGLIERRDSSLPVGLDWLAGTVADLAQLPVDELCDELLARVGDQVEDDVALLAVRAYPEDAPRPEEAGPSDDPRAAPTLGSIR